MHAPPTFPPLGLRLSQTAHAVSTAFEQAMGAAGGSTAAWQILLLLRSGQWQAQSDMAKAMGLTTATVTHHLNALERQGLIRRRREAPDRRSQRVELTPAGAELFERLRSVAQVHDQRLRAALSDHQLEVLERALDKLRLAVTPE